MSAQLSLWSEEIPKANGHGIPGAISTLLTRILNYLASLPESDQIKALNDIKTALHAVSPFRTEPVDCVLWIPADDVQANDYNPNSVAPPEMELLRLSIKADGYTQPIVAYAEDQQYTVVDGFHRNRVGKECVDVRERVKGYLPVVRINESQADRGDRIASTIRHNRARGKHRVEGMSDIVVELKRRNWSDEKICKHLGMDQDEVLRLCQITGLADLFSDQEFSKSWDVEGEVTAEDFKALTDNAESYADVVEDFRTVNTNDGQRVFHTHDKWECFKAGFYNNFPPAGMTKESCEEAYRAFLADASRFAASLQHVVTEWKHSCEHYLTNVAMNRIAWLGQASMCYETGIPSAFRSGFFLLTGMQQQAANETALIALNQWLTANGREAVSLEAALGDGRQSDIY